jgi:NADH-quinone oxidoreductase subunit N
VSGELLALWLPLSVAALGVLVLVVDVLAPPGGAASRGRALGWLTALGLAGIFAASFFVDSAPRTAMHGVYEASEWSLFLQRLFLAAGVLGVLGGLDDVAARTPRRQSEHWITLLFSLLGMVLVPGARDLVLVVVAFELMSIPLYVLAAWAKNDVPAGSDDRGLAGEAAIKLYLVGATSTAVTLFGLALLTGMQGTTRLADLGAAAMTPLSTLGLVMVLAGLGYKIGMAPFHMWVPDTYQGARTPFVAFLSVAPKAAGIAVVATIFSLGMHAHAGRWVPPLSLFALLSMAVGNLLALAQTDLRRLLGYSGIAQMGYVLVALATAETFGTGMVLFFLVAYMFTNLGAFLVVHATETAGGGHGMDSLSGLFRRAPGLALALLLFLLSLAGIPFVVGFWAKLYVFLAAWRAGLVGLVIAAIVLAVLGLFYYLRVLRAAYMTDEGDLPAPKTGTPLRAAIALCALMVAGLGLWPSPLVDASTRASAALLGEVPAPPAAPALARR